ncbi:MAG TPA: hypothetical protein DCL48_14960 [Alphaproteobacteria bacterium]|nr:hypothetical protein [Alphaproteobacteria bacterium]
MARHLAKPHGRGQRKQALIRRSISTSYYAAFHGILQAVADMIVLQKNRRLGLYETVYRRVQHRSLRDVCKALQQSNSPVWAEWGEPPDPSLVGIASNLLYLHQAREVADYGRPESAYSWADADRHATFAEELLGTLTVLNDDLRRKFLVAVLIAK